MSLYARNATDLGRRMTSFSAENAKRTTTIHVWRTLSCRSSLTDLANGTALVASFVWFVMEHKEFRNVALAKEVSIPAASA
jgi:hypothetical protein